jgi:predicted transposase YdaD
MKDLVQRYPADWISFLGSGTPESLGSVEVVDANLSTVSVEVDKVIRVGGPTPWLAHLEFQTSYDPTMGQRLLRYNTMLHVEHQLTVASILVLLRRSANGPALDGAYHLALPGGEPYLTFAYAVRRIWREPADELLRGALGTLPLVPLGRSSRTELPGLLRTIDERFTHEATLAEAESLRVMTYTLLGLRFPPAMADQLMPGIRSMRDSLTYQAIVEEGVERGRTEGRVEEARELLLQLGEERFGSPPRRIRAMLAAIEDHDRLHALALSVIRVGSWDELLASR